MHLNISFVKESRCENDNVSKALQRKLNLSLNPKLRRLTGSGNGVGISELEGKIAHKPQRMLNSKEKEFKMYANLLFPLRLVSKQQQKLGECQRQ